ncbi:lipid-A-disaccharide synthase N-terminal domain-containing protein [Fusobacterium sp.]|uniref:lipid-A-disaccharide synthase N-terminal domain-containing protein n=1 Tax=Fusobacterium sp. TaxID=68766 RepID=UPI0026249ABE|nr:lipid-A-disaccharide synthase N-terminal domain-containing protein [Fusobacterium sp.]
MFDLNFFMVIGLIGQGLFSMRFIVQWIASERAGKSVIPFTFWIFSFGGSLFLLIYAIYRKDPVFILGQAPNLLIYSRNIWLIKKNKK